MAWTSLITGVTDIRFFIMSVMPCGPCCSVVQPCACAAATVLCRFRCVVIMRMRCLVTALRGL